LTSEPAFDEEGKPKQETPGLSIRALRDSFDFADCLVLLGFGLLVTAAWLLHTGAGIALLGAGLIVIGVRSGPKQT
jgi:hypothetical protein